MDLASISIRTYKRVLTGSINVLEKGQHYFTDEGINSDEIVNVSLIDDMWALDKQVNSVRHHSLGSLEGLVAGEFSPPPPIPEMRYVELVNHLRHAQAEIEKFDSQAINSLSDSTILFRVGENEIPFKATHFVNGFSLPNLYFHATTVYDILRMKGVPLTKRDYLGYLDTGF